MLIHQARLLTKYIVLLGLAGVVLFSAHTAFGQCSQSRTIIDPNPDNDISITFQIALSTGGLFASIQANPQPIQVIHSSRLESVTIYNLTTGINYFFGNPNDATTMTLSAGQLAPVGQGDWYVVIAQTTDYFTGYGEWSSNVSGEFNVSQGGSCVFPADLTISKTHVGNFTQGGTGAFNLSVSNVGSGASSGTVTVTDTLPADLPPTGASGSGWACSISGQNVSCTRSDALAAGASYPTITVNTSVSPTAPSSVSNTATVSGGGDGNAANNSSTDTVAINPRPASLSFTKSVTDTNGGIVEAGDILEYTLTVSNAASAGTATNIVLTDPIPANTSFVAGSLTITSGANAGGKTDGSGDDQAEFTGSQVIFRLGAGASAASGGSLAGGESTVIKFRVQIGAGVGGSVAITNTATLTSSAPTLTAQASITTTRREIHFAITPDGSSFPSPIPGQAVTLPFTFTNTGNINSLVYFPDQGAGIWVPSGAGAFTITKVFIDYNNNGVFDSGDVDITTSPPGSYPAAFVAAGGTTKVIVQGTVSPGTASGTSITVRIGSGDGPLPARDDIPNGTSPHRVTAVEQVGNTPDNGYREATGDYVFTVALGPLLGPVGQPGAVGPTSNNDDYTNRTTVTGLAGVPPGGLTTAGGTVIFTNTVQNNGSSADPMIVTAPTVPAGFTVEISTNGGASYTNVTGGGGVSMPAVPAGGTANILVRITAPAGVAVLTGYSTIIRVTSSFASTATNDTIDRLYTGFIRSVKTQTVTNSTGVGGPTDAVSGAVIRYSVTYTNITTSGGTGNVNLTATNVTITENGNLAPNNWAGRTDQVAGSATDTSGGSITGDVAGSSVLTATISTLAPGAGGTFSFSRRVR